jgi:hypothetical protein
MCHTGQHILAKVVHKMRVFRMKMESIYSIHNRTCLKVRKTLVVFYLRMEKLVQIDVEFRQACSVAVLTFGVVSCNTPWLS